MMVLRRPTAHDMPLVLEWRNHPSVASYMYRDEPISVEEHSEWFPSTYSDTGTSVFRIAELDMRAVGWVGITKIDRRNHSCEWGGYLQPAAPRGIGLGREMLQQSLAFVFSQLDINRVSVEVLSTNVSALSLYESIGFVREGVLRERAWQSRGPQDALLLSLLRNDWQYSSTK